MKVILLEKIKQLGEVGAEVAVKSGYGRNYLIPQGKAVLATRDNIAYFNEKRAEFEQAAAEKLAAEQARASKIDGAVITITAKVSDEGKLYGSITTAEIIDELAALGHEVHRSEVLLPNGAIREEGEHVAKVLLHHGEVEANVAIKIIGEK